MEHVDAIVLDGFFNAIECSLKYLLENTGEMFVVNLVSFTQSNCFISLGELFIAIMFIVDRVDLGWDKHLVSQSGHSTGSLNKGYGKSRLPVTVPLRLTI